MMVGQKKFKEKVPDVSDPNQNIEIKCNFKPTFTNQKGTEKLVKDEYM